MRNLLILTLGFAFLIACEGPQGPPGRDGNVFEYSTFVYTIDSDAWISYDNVEGYYAEVDAPELTYEMLDYGYFITYMNVQTEDDPRFIELPRTEVTRDQNGNVFSMEFYPNYLLNTVRIEYFDTHPEGALRPNSSHEFRTVIVSDPQNYSALKSRVDISDHDAVMNELKENGNKINNPVME